MLKEARIKKNLTQEELAERLNISVRHLQRLEKNENITLDMIKKIVKELKISNKEIIKYIKK